jgi:hypothetical protein
MVYAAKGSAASFPSFDPVKTLGEPSYVKSDGLAVPPYIVIGGGYSSAGAASIGEPGWSVANTTLQGYHFLSTLTHMQGHHELKFGGEYRLAEACYFDAGVPGGYEPFDQLGTSEFLYYPIVIAGSGISALGGDGMATFLTGLGEPYSWGDYRIDVAWATSGQRWGGFIQDNWRASQKLTVNIGLRYDLEIPLTERHDRMDYLDLTQSIPIHPAPIQASSWPSVLGPIPDVTHPVGGLQFMSPSHPRLYNTVYKDFGPRLGLAYRLKENLVLRTGYGLFYQGTNSSGNISGAEGFIEDTYWLASMNGDGVTPWGRLSNPFPDGIRMPTGSSLGNLTNLGLSITDALPTANAPAYMQTWSAGFQYRLPGNWLIDANYIGTKGTHLYYYGTGGALDAVGPWIEKEATNPALVKALSTYIPNPYYGVISAYGCGMCGPTIQASQFMYPYPQFAGVSVWALPVANSSYEAFQLRIEKRLSKGLAALISYTNSKSIDDASIGTSVWLGGFARLRDPNDLKLERSLSEYDIPQVFQFSYIYQLPFGNGKKWGGKWNSVLNGFLGGWQTNGIWRFDNGMPLSLSDSGDTPPLSYGGGVPNISGTLKVNPKSQWFTNGYFANASQVLSVPPPYTIGTAPRTEPNVRVPGTQNATLSVFKQFSLNKMREGSHLEFRVESFNAFNHPQFGGINTTWNVGGFGAVTSQANVPRQVQMALKLYF